MIVECPRCRARYRVESDVLDEDQTFKCSRCSHVFAHEASERGDAAVPAPSAPASGAARSAPPPRVEPAKPQARRPAGREDPSLSLPFWKAGAGRSKPVDEPDGIEDADDLDEAPRPAAAPPAGRTLAPSIVIPPSPSREHDFSFGDDDVHLDEPEREPARDDEPRFVRGEDDLRVDEPSGAGAGRPYFIFLAALLLIYAILSIDLLNHPARAEQLLASVPFVGDVLAEDHLMQTRVQLQDVEGAYQHIKDERSVFVISGRAVNTANEPLKGVQIESALFDATGRPLEVKSIYCGNAMSLKIVKDLSTKEISLLQQLEPPKRFEIRPGESAGFSVVFVSPPAAVREFSARVVAAQSSDA